MKARLSILCALTALSVLILLAACATAMNHEEINGIWVNEKTTPQKEVDTPNGWKQYIHVSDTVPFSEGTAVITAKWTDSEGNVWYKILCETSAKDNSEKFTVLTKLSKSATVKESIWRAPANDEEMKSPPYPEKIDPQDYFYSIYYRKE